MKKVNFQSKLSVVFLKEKKRFIAYAPALDLSTSGKSFEEAKKRFVEAAMIFFEEINENGTTIKVLEDLGWEKQSSKWEPPLVVSRQSESISIPVAA